MEIGSPTNHFGRKTMPIWRGRVAAIMACGPVRLALRAGRHRSAQRSGWPTRSKLPS